LAKANLFDAVIGVAGTSRDSRNCGMWDLLGHCYSAQFRACAPLRLGLLVGCLRP